MILRLYLNYKEGRNALSRCGLKSSKHRGNDDRIRALLFADRLLEHVQHGIRRYGLVIKIVHRVFAVEGLPPIILNPGGVVPAVEINLVKTFGCVAGRSDPDPLEFSFFYGNLYPHEFPVLEINYAVLVILPGQTILPGGAECYPV